MFGGQLLPQIDQHVETSKVRILKFQVLIVKQLCLPLDLPGLLKQFDKNCHLRSQDLRFHWLNNVVNRAERISSSKVTYAGAVGGKKNDRHVARFLAAAYEFSRFQSFHAGHVDI